jgi:hypothetical protein
VYKFQLRRKIEATDSSNYVTFADFILSGTNGDEDYLQRVMLMDEAAFHKNGSVFRYNCRIWGLQQPDKFSDYVHETPNVKVVGLFLSFLFSSVEKPLLGTFI